MENRMQSNIGGNYTADERDDDDFATRKLPITLEYPSSAGNLGNPRILFMKRISKQGNPKWQETRSL